jgi:crotonobetaine/carnitine-CoA ligase
MFLGGSGSVSGATLPEDAPTVSISDFFEARVAEAPDRPWLFFESDSWTLGDAAGLVDRIAVGLANRGVERGDCVAILVGQRPEAIFVWLAANRLGAIVMILNPALKPTEIDGLFAIARPRVAVRTALEVSELASGGAGSPRRAVSPDDVAVYLGTSGTTGAPKLVAQTHRTYVLTAEAVPAWLGLDGSDRLMTSLPLFHVNAQAYSTMGSLGARASLALLPKFSASRFWADAAKLGATQFNAVGAMIHILLETAPTPAERAHRVRFCYAALALSEEKHRAFEARFGLRMIVGYGMSETTFGTIWPLDRPPKYGTMGVLRQHPQLGEINRARLGPDGELFLSNPAIAKNATVEDGWLATGDIVRRDEDGYFTFVSRKKEILRRRGENVAAAEIENVLLAHPSVLEAAAVGVPSALGEDDIEAFVAPRPGSTIDVEALAAFCRERLADFKVPSKLHVRESLPKTATQRIAKHLLTSS